MRIAIIGLGSMGRRHLTNLLSVAPMVEVVLYDKNPETYQSLTGVIQAWSAFSAIDVSDAVMICTPHEAHLDTLAFCAEMNKPVFVEKPLVGLDHTRSAARLIDSPFADRSAVGFCYPFHPVMPDVLADAESLRALDIEAWDDLHGRYGDTILETMTSHAVSIAIRAFGPVRRVIANTDGRRVEAELYHVTDARTDIFQRMDLGPRHSRVGDRLLYPDDGMYVDELSCWLDVLAGGRRDPRLATLAEGLAVNNVLREIRKRGQKATVIHG